MAVEPILHAPCAAEAPGTEYTIQDYQVVIDTDCTKCTGPFVSIQYQDSGLGVEFCQSNRCISPSGLKFAFKTCTYDVEYGVDSRCHDENDSSDRYRQRVNEGQLATQVQYSVPPAATLSVVEDYWTL